MTYPMGFKVGGIVPEAIGSASASKEQKIGELRAIVDGIVRMDPHHGRPMRDARKELPTVRKMTAAFRAHEGSHQAVRELAVQKVLLPAGLQPIRSADLFAGRFADGPVGYSPEIWGGYVGYYFLEAPVEAVLASPDLPEAERKEWEDLRTFWREKATHNLGYREAWNYCLPRLKATMGKDFLDLSEHFKFMADGGSANPLILWTFTDATNRVAGPFMDMSRLLDLGVEGLIRLVRERASANTDSASVPFYESVTGSLELFRDEVIGRYEREARSAGLTELADTLAAVRSDPPRTLRQAIQLAWLYILVTRVLNVGRLDVWFGKFYTDDLAAGRLTPDSAQTLVNSFWRLMYDEGHNFNSRVVLGGKDRENPASADRFALLCLESTRKFKLTRPQTTLRMYEGMNEAVAEAAFKAIGEGCTFPMLLNDDVNIPAVATAFGVTEQEAALYVPLGCGELLLEKINICSPNSAFLPSKCLEYALHDGRDGLTGHQIGPRTGNPASFVRFEQLWKAYDTQVRYFMELSALKHAIGHRVVRREAPFLLVSALYHDCLEKGRGLLDGVRYLDGTTEVVGYSNAADSLTALKKLVYDEKRYSLLEIVTALDSNFAGSGSLQKELLACPKFGNDIPEADEMAGRVHEHLAYCALNHSGALGEIRKYMIVHVNNHAHVAFGGLTAASADGRGNHETLANANNPTPGRDTNGTTAMMKSLASISPSIHGGAVQNMKFSRQMFTDYLPKTRALFKAYFAMGGTQAMVTVVSREDLEDAMSHPERHQNLVVRVGGYSARFVELSRDVQLEILNRTLN
jgi:pyruvate-formate lyase